MIGGVLKNYVFPSAEEECIFSGTTLCELFEIWKIKNKYFKNRSAIDAYL